MSAAEHAPLDEWDAYNKQERKRIQALIRCRDYLASKDSYSYHIKQLIEAIDAGLDFLRTADHPMPKVEHLAALRIRRDWLRKINNKNGYQMQEFGAFNWLMNLLYAASPRKDEN